MVGQVRAQQVHGSGEVQRKGRGCLGFRVTCTLRLHQETHGIYLKYMGHSIQGASMAIRSCLEQRGLEMQEVCPPVGVIP